jgi:hypothetical protein
MAKSWLSSVSRLLCSRANTNENLPTVRVGTQVIDPDHRQAVRLTDGHHPVQEATIFGGDLLGFHDLRKLFRPAKF